MQCKETQGYFGNITSVYSKQGLRSHSGIDIQCGYGTDIECPVNGFVYKVLNDKRPANDGSGFWAVFIITEYKGQLREVCVGHCSEIMVTEGQYVSKGQIIAKEGNRGTVFYNGQQITLAMQKAGNKLGTHRHWQSREIKATSNFKASKVYLTLDGVYKDDKGQRYEVPNYYNGHNGLLPDIKDILSDYALWKKAEEEKKLQEAIKDNIEVSTEIKQSWLNILAEYGKILLDLIKLK